MRGVDRGTKLGFGQYQKTISLALSDNRFFF